MLIERFWDRKQTLLFQKMFNSNSLSRFGLCWVTKFHQKWFSIKVWWLWNSQFKWGDVNLKFEIQNLKNKIIVGRLKNSFPFSPSKSNSINSLSSFPVDGLFGITYAAHHMRNYIQYCLSHPKVWKTDIIECWPS